MQFHGSFENDFARNNIIFGVDNSSSSHFDNRENNFLTLIEGPSYGINGLALTLLKQIHNFVAFAL